MVDDVLKNNNNWSDAGCLCTSAARGGSRSVIGLTVAGAVRNPLPSTREW